MVLACCACSACAARDVAQAGALRADDTRLARKLQNRAFGQPLVLQSSENANGSTDDASALVPEPLAFVSSEPKSADHRCEAMILHIHTKYCHTLTWPEGTSNHRIRLEAVEPAKK